MENKSQSCQINVCVKRESRHTVAVQMLLCCNATPLIPECHHAVYHHTLRQQYTGFVSK